MPIYSLFCTLDNFRYFVIIRIIGGGRAWKREKSWFSEGASQQMMIIIAIFVVIFKVMTLTTDYRHHYFHRKLIVFRWFQGFHWQALIERSIDPPIRPKVTIISPPSLQGNTRPALDGVCAVSI